MKVLFIGGTGTISTAISKRVLSNPDNELYLINRGSRNSILDGNLKEIRADINDEADVAAKLEGLTFDVVCDFICFTPDQIKRDYRLFKGRTSQFMFISTASAYNKPPRNYVITEGTSLANPYWEYSRKKIECEEFLMEKYREEGFPVTIIRPSHTYDERKLPLGVHGRIGSFSVLKRMLEGKPVLIHGDGTSLWTLTHNSDFAKGFVGLMGNPLALGEAFQITSGESLTWNQIYQCIADALGVELKPYYVTSRFLADVAPELDFEGSLLGDKSYSVIFDQKKLRRAVPTFIPEVPIFRGLKMAVDYIMSHPLCQEEDPEFDAFCDCVIDTMEKAKASCRQEVTKLLKN